MNSAFLLGRLTRDPEIIDLGGDARCARYTLAVNREFRTQEGDKADFIRCVSFGQPAQNAERYLKKGMLICVRGWIRTGSYKNKDGKTIYTTEVQVDRVEFAESKRAREEAEKEGEAPAKIHTSDVSKTSASRNEPERTVGPVEDDFMTIPDGFDEDNVPFS